MSVTKRLRYEVFRRDGHTCRYCGAGAPDVQITVDHVVPLALGGTDEPANLVTACRSCNAGKSSMPVDAPLVDSVSADALRWAHAMRRAAEIQADDRRRVESMIDGFITVWADHFIEAVRDDPQEMALPRDWQISIERLTKAGLDGADFVYAIEATMAPTNIPWDRLFRYFCGVCWNKVKERQAIARDLLAAEDDR